MTGTDTETRPLLYTAEQASLRIGAGDDGRPIVSAYWLKRNAGLRRIPCTYIGKSPSWSEQDIADLIEQRRRTPRVAGRRAR